MYYLKNTSNSVGRGNKEKLTLKENIVIYFLALLPLIITVIIHFNNI